MAVNLAHATDKTSLRHPNRQQAQYRVIAREFLAAGVKPALMTALADIRPHMQPVAEAMTEMAALR